jgi:hypothetical protein
MSGGESLPISIKDVSAYNNSLELWIETNLTTG